MKTEEKEFKNTDGENLMAWMSTIPVGEIDGVRRQLMDECEVSRYVLAHWLAGRTRIPPLAKKVIERIAGKDLFNQN